MSTFDALPATPEAFTTALRASAKLPKGEIVSVTVTEQQQTAISHLRFLEVAYSSASLRALPTRLLLKWPIQPSTEMGGDAETTFYRNLAPALSSPPIVRCLATAPVVGTEQWVLLEDLRRTHDSPAWPDRPDDQDLQSAVVVLARLHAGWWEGQSFFSLHTDHMQHSRPFRHQT